MGKFKKFMSNLTTGILTTSVLIAGANLANQIVITNKVTGDDYKTPALINEDTNLLNAGANLLDYEQMSDMVRLKHNDGRPIWVHIDDSVKAEDVKLIQQTLDVYETMFKDINDKYHFEVVDFSTYLFKYAIGETTIKYQIKDISSFQANGLNESRSVAFNQKFIKNSIISLNSTLAQEPEFRYYVLLHELSHTFGFGDVYYHGNTPNTNTYFGNTIMQISVLQQKISRLSPEDYKRLHALYNTSHFKDGTVIPTALEKTLDKIKEYESDYYDYVIEKMKENMHSYSGFNFQQIIEAEIARLDLVYKNTRLDVRNEVDEYENKVTLENGIYKWQAYKNGELYHETQGTYLEQGNVIIIPTLNIQAPSFDVSYNGRVKDTAIVSVALVKENGNHYMIPLDTLAQLRMNATATMMKELNAKEQNQEEVEVLFTSGDYQLVVPKELARSLNQNGREI